MLSFLLAVVGEYGLHLGPHTQHRACRVEIMELTSKSWLVVVQTCEDVVGFPPQANLALHADSLVLAVALPEGVAAGLGTAVVLLVPVFLALLLRHLLVLLLQLGQRLLLDLLAGVGPVDEILLPALLHLLVSLTLLVHDGQDGRLLPVPHLVAQPEPLELCGGTLLLLH